MSVLRRILAKARPPLELIGPPDPISNIRPVIVDSPARGPRRETHPYSLAEFGAKDEDDADLQWRIERERLNALNHVFWYDSNTRFMRGKQLVLDRLHAQAEQPTAREKEAALSEFYSRWTVLESARQTAYTAEWNRRNYTVITLAMRRQLRMWRDLFR